MFLESISQGYFDVLRLFFVHNNNGGKNEKRYCKDFTAWWAS